MSSRAIRKVALVAAISLLAALAPAFLGVSSFAAQADDACVVLDNTGGFSPGNSVARSKTNGECTSAEEDNAHAAVTICADTDATDDDDASTAGFADVGNLGIVFVDAGVGTVTTRQGVIVNANGDRIVEASDSNFPIGADGDLFVVNLIDAEEDDGPQGEATVAGTGISGTQANC